MKDKIIGIVPILMEKCIEESDNDITKLKCTVNTETNKMKMLKKSSSHTDAVRVHMLTQSESA